MPLKSVFLFVFLAVPMAQLRAATGDKNTLGGAWIPSAAELGGKTFPEEIRKTITLRVQGELYRAEVGEQVDMGTLKINASATPKELDITGTEGPNKGRTILAIYELEGDVLRICYDLSGKSRPTEFKTKEGTQLFLVTYALKKENSPHGDAVALVLRAQADEIRKLESIDQRDLALNDHWWHDIKERTWNVKRTVPPGIVDSTHQFSVTYSIDGKKVAVWYVDTRRGIVEKQKVNPE